MAKSRVSCASFNIGSSTTITINRDSSSYTHTLTYTFGTATGTIATKTANVSVGWTPTASTLYAQIPNTTSGYGTITCTTYSGNTVIGTSTAGFYAYAVKSNCLPTVSATTVDTNATTIALTGNSSILIANASKPKVTMTATAKNSATISTRAIDLAGLYATTSPYTFDTIYDHNLYVAATDSRGYSTTVKYDFEALNRFIVYDIVHFNSYSIRRTESTSTTATLTINGYCFKGSFGSQSNTLTLRYRYKVSGGSYGSYTTLTPTWNNDGTFTITASVTGLSTTSQYEFELNVADKITSDTTGTGDLILATGIGDFRIGKNYVQAKNSMIVGDGTNTDFKCFRSKRRINNIPHFSEYGVSNLDNMAGIVMQLYKTVSGTNTRLARYDIRQDGFMYNYNTSMSIAEIMSSAPSISGSGTQGYLLLNGGDSATPILIQWGRINKVPDGANVVTYVDINFMYAFSGQPLCYVQPTHNLGTALETACNTPTANGVRIYLKRANTSNTGLIWFAIGNGTPSLPA